ncbi:lipoprotein-releasing system permease protein [Lacinutrix venerupis]|uniref:ABC transporter permease n=1 Tax=Lacinutrix venerupis TaxID=1486034 RepID=UPI000EACED86|nr:FtsX-like permease family protein [Lacinutrix venerupis]RLJ63367.1 lipoprotein-releasing system permease protein [Lacinutrix venerupis]
MSFSLYIAKRYLRSKSTNNAINFITYIAIAGIIIGSASLFVVLSGFAGLRDFTLEFTTVIDPDLKAEATIGKSFVLDSIQEKQLQDIQGIASFSKVIEERVISSFDDKKQPLIIKGVDANYNKVYVLDSILWKGSWLTDKTNQVVVGYGVSNSLNIGLLDYGKRITLLVPKPGKGQITSLNQAFNQIETVNVGVFTVNEQLDGSYIFSSLEAAQQLLSFNNNQITNIEFRLKKGANEDSIKTQIQSVLGDNITLKNTAQLNDALNKMLNTENLLVYLLLTLVSIILIFNVIGSIIMMILDKKKTLTTLYSIGATLKDIRRIFFIQGAAMTIIGSLIGLFLGYLVSLNQVYGPEYLKVYITQTLPYPLSIKLENMLIVFVTITVLGLIASKIASTRISKNMVKTG